MSSIFHAKGGGVASAACTFFWSSFATAVGREDGIALGMLGKLPH